MIRHTKGYFDYSWSKGQNSEVGDVVSIEFEAVDGSRIQRVTTVADFAGKLKGQSFRYTMETLDETVIDAGGAVTVTTVSSVIGGALPAGSFSTAANTAGQRTRAYDAALSVSGSASSGDYTGTMDYTDKNARSVTFDFDLTPEAGLVLIGRHGRGDIRFDNGNVDHGSSSASRSVEVDNMERGGSFIGQISGNVLTRTYTGAGGTTHDIMVSPAMAVIDGDLDDGTPGTSE